MSHLCRRWWKRGLDCPMALEDEHQKDSDEDAEAEPHGALTAVKQERLEQTVREMAVGAGVEARGSVAVRAMMKQAIQVGYPEDVAEEGLADAISDRVRNIPDLHDVAGPAAAAEVLRRMQHGTQRFSAPFRGGAGGFQFNAAERMRARMPAVP